jgi:hypothetical protein
MVLLALHRQASSLTRMAAQLMTAPPASELWQFIWPLDLPLGPANELGCHLTLCSQSPCKAPHVSEILFIHLMTYFRLQDCRHAFVVDRDPRRRLQ